MKGDEQAPAGKSFYQQSRPVNDSPEAYGSDYASTKRAVIFGSKGIKQHGNA